MALRHRARQTDRGADGAARDLQAADQRGHQRARPAAFKTAPAIVDGLAQRHGHGTVGHGDAVDLDGLPNAGMVDELVGDGAHVGRRHFANRLRPFRRVGSHVLDQLREAGAALEQAFGQHFLVGADLDRIDLVAAFNRLLQIRAVVRPRTALRQVPNQRLAAAAIAQVKAVRTHQIRRRSTRCEEGHIEPLTRHFVQQHMDQRVEKGSVGLGLDRHPLRRAGAGDREMRFNLHALQAANARLRMAPDTHHTTGGLDVVATGDQVIAQRRIGCDDKSAVPELTVQMFGVIALDALA